MSTNQPLRTLGQNTEFHRLIAQHKFDREEKQELVKLVSNGRETSSAKLTQAEMQKAIDRLSSGTTSSVKRMRAKIYAIYRDIADLGPNGTYTFQQEDYNAVDAFMKRCFKKPLYKLTYEELPDAVTAMESWRNWGLNKAVQRLLDGVF